VADSLQIENLIPLKKKKALKKGSLIKPDVLKNLFSSDRGNKPKLEKDREVE
jgi:hypothetical protein